jgi:septum formation protein
MNDKTPKAMNRKNPLPGILHASSLTLHLPLILASGSPRRRELLTEAGYEFDVVVPSESAECGMCSKESPEELVARLARQKAADVALRIDHGLIIACDTVADCEGQILGKPANDDHARRMLQMLSGREHRVLSGLCLWPVPGGAAQTRVAQTRLRMDQLTPLQIDEYVASGLWEGKAGGFGYQDRLGWLHVLSGGESNVVGLPLELLAEMLEKLRNDEGRMTNVERMTKFK